MFTAMDVLVIVKVAVLAFKGVAVDVATVVFAGVLVKVSVLTGVEETIKVL